MDIFSYFYRNLLVEFERVGQNSGGGGGMYFKWLYFFKVKFKGNIILKYENNNIFEILFIFILYLRVFCL